MGLAPYSATVIQTPLLAASSRDELIRHGIARWCRLVDVAVEQHYALGARLGQPAIRLVAFPQLSSSAEWWGRMSSTAAELALELPGEEFLPLLTKAREHRVYIAGAALERDLAWPDCTFNCAFVIGPDGSVVHRYRQIGVGSQALGQITSPYDVLDRYLARYGTGRTVAQVLLPVTDTEIGRIATYTTDDGLYPEIPRGLVLNGAEVVVRPVEWVTGTYPVGPDALRVNNQMRCYDNVIYLLSPNSARTLETENESRATVEQWTCGHSLIVDHFGKVMAEAGSFGEEIVTATIDVQGLRRRRTSPGFNYPAQLLSEIYADVWRVHARRALGLMPNRGPATQHENGARVVESVERLYHAGLYVRPSVLNTVGP